MAQPKPPSYADILQFVLHVAVAACVAGEEYIAAAVIGGALYLGAILEGSK